MCTTGINFKHDNANLGLAGLSATSVASTCVRQLIYISESHYYCYSGRVKKQYQQVTATQGAIVGLAGTTQNNGIVLSQEQCKTDMQSNTIKQRLLAGSACAAGKTTALMSTLATSLHANGEHRHVMRGNQ